MMKPRADRSILSGKRLKGRGDPLPTSPKYASRFVIAIRMLTCVIGGGTRRAVGVGSPLLKLLDEVEHQLVADSQLRSMLYRNPIVHKSPAVWIVAA